MYLGNIKGIFMESQLLKLWNELGKVLFKLKNWTRKGLHLNPNGCPEGTGTEFKFKKRNGPNGIRTRVTDVRGRCPRPLDDGTSKNQLIRLPGLKPGVCSELILSGAFYPDL